jgi:hypothetical protein
MSLPIPVALTGCVGRQAPSAFGRFRLVEQGSGRAPCRDQPGTAPSRAVPRMPRPRRRLEPRRTVAGGSDTARQLGRRCGSPRRTPSATIGRREIRHLRGTPRGCWPASNPRCHSRRVEALARGDRVTSNNPMENGSMGRGWDRRARPARSVVCLPSHPGGLVASGGARRLRYVELEQDVTLWRRRGPRGDVASLRVAASRASRRLTSSALPVTWNSPSVPMMSGTWQCRA